MKEAEHVLMSKELLDILKPGSSNSKANNEFDLFKRAKFIVGNEDHYATISSILLDDYSLTIKAISSIDTILFLLRKSKNKKLKLPDILPDRNDFIISSIEVEGDGKFKLTAVVVNT